MMTKIEKLDAKGYRKFGLTTGAILIALFGLVIPWVFNLNFPKWPWILGSGLGAWALLAPIIIIMLLLGALIVLSQGSAVAPFIYKLF